FFEAKICSGCAPAGSDKKLGGPVRSGASSDFACGSGLVIKARGGGALIFAGPPRPELAPLAGGWPPLMLTSMPFFTLPLPVAFPPLMLAGPPAAPPFAPGVPFGEPPGTPGCLPSGEMETRAARFPCGRTTGAGGAGDADSAINVVTLPCATPDCAET